MTLKEKLTNAAIQYDQKQLGKRGYNPYALPQYLLRIDEIAEDVDRGADPRKAIAAGFSGRLLNTMMKAAGLGMATDSECRGEGQGWAYSPITKSL